MRIATSLEEIVKLMKEERGTKGTPITQPPGEEQKRYRYFWRGNIND